MINLAVATTPTVIMPCAESGNAGLESLTVVALIGLTILAANASPQTVIDLLAVEP